jgi:hypothetical protein
MVDPEKILALSLPPPPNYPYEECLPIKAAELKSAAKPVCSLLLDGTRSYLGSPDGVRRLVLYEMTNGYPLVVSMDNGDNVWTNLEFYTHPGK